MESFATPYPLIFSDGDQEIDKGQVGIHSVLSFKRFQDQLSRLIGQPANQLSAVFVCRRTARDGEKRQKLPINENTNFNIILNQHNPSKERDCHFLVSLKKSKKERKGARKKSTEAENADDDDSTSSRGDTSPAGERPRHVSDDCFSSPVSVLEQPTESDASSPSTSPPERVQVIEARKEAVVVEPSSPTKSSSEPETLPVARIGGQPLQRSLNEQAKFGPIGAAPKLDQQQQQPQHYHFSSGGEAARFKDPVPQQALGSGRLPGVIGVQRMNGVPVFTSDASNTRLLGARGLSQSIQFNQHQFQQHYQHQFQQQHQQRYFGLQQRSIMSRGAEMSGDYTMSEQFCPDCLSYKERNIRPPPFHCCINDRITAGFRGPSPAGPIERPVKRQVKAAA